MCPAVLQSAPELPVTTQEQFTEGHRTKLLFKSCSFCVDEVTTRLPASALKQEHHKTCGRCCVEETVLLLSHVSEHRHYTTLKTGYLWCSGNVHFQWILVLVKLCSDFWHVFTAVPCLKEVMSELWQVTRLKPGACSDLVETSVLSDLITFSPMRPEIWSLEPHSGGQGHTRLQMHPGPHIQDRLLSVRLWPAATVSQKLIKSIFMLLSVQCVDLPVATVTISTMIDT